MHSARYFDANARLRVVDTRLAGNGELGLPGDGPAYEEYRYDALGRRVLRRARHTPSEGMPADSAKLDLIQRFVWDGDHLLAEIQAPGANPASAAVLESDTLVLANGTVTSNTEYFGRVLYLPGESLDQPISVVRIGYAKLVGGLFRVWDPVAIAPHWDNQGRGFNSVVYGPTPRCKTVNGSTECLTIQWPVVLAYGKRSSHTWPQYAYNGWFGSLVQDQMDGTGQMYRRNRYYDPHTGRFTQEDPIGLAGGLNVYGFAAGDPITHSDPFGLCVDGATTLACLYAAVEIGFTLYDIGDLAVTSWRWITGRTSGRAVLLTGGAVLTGMVVWGGGYGRAAREGVERAAASAAQAERLRASLAVQEIFGARPVGSALKSDAGHRAATFAIPANGRGRMFTIRGGDGHRYNLTQVEGELNGRRGIFEWVVNDAGELTHQRFIGGVRITGAPNQRP